MIIINQFSFFNTNLHSTLTWSESHFPTNISPSMSFSRTVLKILSLWNFSFICEGLCHPIVDCNHSSWSVSFWIRTFRKDRRGIDFNSRAFQSTFWGSPRIQTDKISSSLHNSVAICNKNLSRRNIQCLKRTLIGWSLDVNINTGARAVN